MGKCSATLYLRRSVIITAEYAVDEALQLKVG